MKPQILIIAAVIVAIITGAGGFFGGMAYAQSQQASALAAFQAQRGAGQFGNGQPGQGNFPQGAPNGAQGGFRGQNAALGSPVANGQIKSINGDTVEISTAESVVTVKVNDTTQITKTDRGTLSDLQVGERVTVFSKETGANPTASSIQMNALQPASQPAPNGAP